MFDEFKKVRRDRFQESLYSKEIKSLKGLEKAEVYLELKRASTMELSL